VDTPLHQREQHQSPVAGYSKCVKTKPKAGSKKRRDAASGAEHTKPSNIRSTIRATEGKRWTARQPGRG
jgi:hypothetical protein